MGSSSSKQNEKRRVSIKKSLRFQTRNRDSNSTTRPMSYAGDDQTMELSSRRPMSMFETFPSISDQQSVEDLEIYQQTTSKQNRFLFCRQIETFDSRWHVLTVELEKKINQQFEKNFSKSNKTKRLNGRNLHERVVTHRSSDGIAMTVERRTA